MSGALAGRRTDKELEKGRVETARVKRYWAGKAPAWAEEQQAEEVVVVKKEASRTAIAAPVIVKKADDPRLARLAQRSRDDEGVKERHREIHTAQVVRRRRPTEEAEEAAGPSSEGDDEEGDEEGGRAAGRRAAADDEQEEEDEEEIAARRQALRERWVARECVLLPGSSVHHVLRMLPGHALVG